MAHGDEREGQPAGDDGHGIRRLRPPRLTGLAPNVTFGSGVGTGRPGCGVRSRVARHPIHVVPRGRRRWTCPVHRPRSGQARTRETNDIDPLGRKAGDLVVRGGLSARSRLLLRVPWQLRARSTRRGRAWLRGVPGVQETARSAVSCTGLRGASREIAPSSKGFAASARNPALNNRGIRAILKEPPQEAVRDALAWTWRVGDLRRIQRGGIYALHV